MNTDEIMILVEERYRQMGIIRKSSIEIENAINENIERRCKKGVTFRNDNGTNGVSEHV